MSAPFKRTRTLKITEIANEVISAIKKELSSKKDNINESKVEVILMGHGARPFGSYLPTDYRDITIKVGNTRWNGLDDYDVRALGYELNKRLNEFDNVEKEGLFFSYGNFTPDVEDFPTTFRMFGKPCKEYQQLSKLMEKKYGITLKVDELYIVNLFGKRGQYNESGKRDYTAFNKNRCEKYINNIKSFGRKKTNASIKNVDDIDTDYSIRYETECYGQRERGIIITL